MKDWAFVRDEHGNPVIAPSHPNWWQDKKNPERCGISVGLESPEDIMGDLEQALNAVEL